MNIDNDGSISFEAVLATGQLDRAVEETVRRIAGLSEAVVSAGGSIDDFFEIIGQNIKEREQNVERYKTQLAELDNLIQQTGAQQYLVKEHKSVTAALEEETKAMGVMAGAYNTLLKEREAITAALNEERQAIETATKAQQTLEATHRTFSTRIREVRNEMQNLVSNGIDIQSEAYKRLEAELVHLTQVQQDVTKRTRLMANDGAMLQGLIEGISGLAGGFSAATGAIGIFAEENENLQNVMLRVQSAMAMAVGIQQVYNALKKDSALQVGVLTQMKEWWAGVVAKAAAAEAAETAAVASNTAAQTADTAATAANATATTAQAAAATTATAANRGLAGSFVLLSTAIKSVPVWGWIVAGVSALGAAIGIMTSKAREAKKAQEEFNDAVVEGSYKAVAGINLMVAQWKTLGNEMAAKERFVKDNKKAFDELGLSISGVADAERVLTDPKNVERYVQAQIIKATADAKRIELMTKARRVAELQNEIASIPDPIQTNPSNPYGTGNILENQKGARKRTLQKELQEAEKFLADGYNTVATLDNSTRALIDSLNSTGQASVGLIAGIEQELTTRREKLKTLTSEADIAKEVKTIEALETRLNKLLGREKKEKNKKEEKDPFIENLKKIKAEYDRFYKWVSSGDKTLVAGASREFEKLKENGASYIEYLRIERDKLLWLGEDQLNTKQAAELKKLQNAIADETGSQGLEIWKKDLASQSEAAKTVLELLELIKRKEEEITDENVQYSQEKKEALDEVREAANKRFKDETSALMEDYAGFLDSKLSLDSKYAQDIELMNKTRLEAANDAEKAAIDRAIAQRKKAYDAAVNDLESYEADLASQVNQLAFEYKLLDIQSKNYLWESDRRKDELEAEKAKVEAEIKLLESRTPTEETTQKIAQLRLEVTKLNVELAKVPKEKLNEIVSGLINITGSLSQVDGDIGKIFGSISKNLDGIVKAFKETGETMSGSDYTSYAVTAANGIIDIINMASTASKRRKQAEREHVMDQIALAHQYALALNEQLRLQAELSGGGFVRDYAGEINASYKAMTDASIKYNEAIEKLAEGRVKVDQKNAVDWGNVGSGAVTGLSAGSAIGTMILPGIGTAIGAAVGGLVGGIVGLFSKKKKDMFGGLLEVYPELIDGQGELNRGLAEALLASNQLDEKTSQLVQNAIDWAGAVEEAKAQVKEVVVSLAGDLGNSIRDALVEAFRAGEDASGRMFDAASKSLEKFIENLVYSTVFSDTFKKFSDRVAESLDIENDGDGNIVDDYQWLMGELQKGKETFNAALKQIKDYAERQGFSMWNPEEAKKSGNSLSGAIKGITEDTASLIAGQLNASRMSHADMANSMRQSLFYLAGIEANTRYLKGIYEKIDNLDKGSSLRASGLS